MTSLLSVEVVAPTPGKYVQAILNLRGSRHRAEGWSKTKNNHCNQCLDTKKLQCSMSKYAPLPSTFEGLASHKRNIIFVFDLHWRLSWKKKMFCLSMAKKTTWKLFLLPVSLGTVVTAGSRPLHGRWKISGLPDFSAAILDGIFLHKCSVANTLRCLLS